MSVGIRHWVVALNYATAERCIAIFDRFREVTDIGVVVIDNASCTELLSAHALATGIPIVHASESESDLGAFELVRKAGHNRILILSERNLGYAGGNNLALAPLSQFVEDGSALIVNPDVDFDVHTARALLLSFDEVVGPSIFEDYLGAVRPPQNKFDFATCFPATERSHVEHVGTVLSGACFKVKTSALRRYGLLPAENFLYDEEPKFFERVHRLGGRPTYLKDLRVRHIGSMSVGKKSFVYFYYIFRNRLNYYRDVGRVHYRVRARFAWHYLVWSMAVARSNLRQRNIAGLRGQWHGFVDGILGRSGQRLER